MLARIMFITLISYYWTENQIGFHESYVSGLNNLNLVWNECNWVRHPNLPAFHCLLTHPQDLTYSPNKNNQPDGAINRKKVIQFALSIRNLYTIL